MAIKIFIDANVFIGSLEKDNHYFKSCQQFFVATKRMNVEFYTSCDLITTIYYVLHKRDKSQALNRIDKINQLCQIVEFGNKEVAESINLMQSDSDYVDLEDTIQYILAKKVACNLIISNDKNFIAKDIKCLSTTQFVNEYPD